MTVQYLPEGNSARIGFDDRYVEAVGNVLNETPQEFAGRTALEVRRACGSGCGFRIATVEPHEQSAGCTACRPEQARQYIDDTVETMRSVEHRHQDAQVLGAELARYGGISAERAYRRALYQLSAPLSIFGLYQRRQSANNEIKPSSKYL